ncbi:MAG TPA: hypothetical protein VM939_01550 [Gemmatimonadaceae bacterium]|nr:hypothetical protein [Gemmatimonadaceae bacterium]
MTDTASTDSIRPTGIRHSLRPVDPKGAAFLGLLLGLGAFWNGALIIAALLILGSAIVWAPRRLDLIICCAIATLLAIIEARFFISSGPGVAPRFHFGFLAATPTVAGIAKYYLKLFGLVIPILLLAAWRLQPRGRWLLASLMVPIAFATTFTFTPDISVNHKFVNAGMRIAAIFAALVLLHVFNSGKSWRPVAFVLFAGLTATGAVDAISLWNFNREKRTHDLADPMLKWALRETDPRAVFAAPPVYHHLVYFTGRYSYLGLPYWAESAGYDVAARQRVLQRIYEGGDPVEIARLAKSEGISYVVVDNVARGHFRALREDALRANFPLVFSQGPTQVYGIAR